MILKGLKITVDTVIGVLSSLLTIAKVYKKSKETAKEPLFECPPEKEDEQEKEVL